MEIVADWYSGSRSGRLDFFKVACPIERLCSSWSGQISGSFYKRAQADSISFGVSASIGIGTSLGFSIATREAY